MIDVPIKVVGQKLKLPVSQRKFVYGTKNFIKLVFDFDVNWNLGMMTYAKFAQDGEEHDERLTSDEYVYLPDYLKPGSFDLSLYSTSGIGDVIGVTESIILDVVRVGNNGASQPDTPSEGECLEFATLEEVKSHLNIP